MRRVDESARGRRPPTDQRAEREAAHERREHRARGGDRVTELERQQPRPGDFVDQRCRSRRRVEENEERRLGACSGDEVKAKRAGDWVSQSAGRQDLEPRTLET